MRKVYGNEKERGGEKEEWRLQYRSENVQFRTAAVPPKSKRKSWKSFSSSVRSYLKTPIYIYETFIDRYVSIQYLF